MGTNIISRRKPLQANIGVFGVGYWKYWEQFDGLLDELQTKQKKFIEKLKVSDVHVVDFGMVDDAETAYDLVPKLKAANLDLIFCDMVTYATSSTFGTIIRNIDIPIVMVALQPILLFIPISQIGVPGNATPYNDSPVTVST